MNAGNTPVFVEAVGIAAPGLANRQAARAVFLGEVEYKSEPIPPYSPALLPPNERRRATPAVRLAFQAAEDAMRGCSIPPADLAAVFASSDADLNVIHRICTALTATPRMISPTDFHNSVHNAASGYWSIAAGARGPSTALSAFDDSFAAGLSEAVGCVCIDRIDTLLVAFDLPPPEPLLAKRPIEQAVGIALVLTRERTPHSTARLTCSYSQSGESTLAEPDLERLRIGNPAARALPLLIAIERAKPATVVLSLRCGQCLSVEVAAP